jgi:hypothetical protein
MDKLDTGHRQATFVHAFPQNLSDDEAQPIAKLSNLVSLETYISQQNTCCSVFKTAGGKINKLLTYPCLRNVDGTHQ